MSVLVYNLIAQLISLLEAEGFAMGVDKHQQILQLVHNLPDDVPPGQLKTLLAPIMSRNPQEQQDFYTIFDQALRQAVEIEQSQQTKKIAKRKTALSWLRHSLLGMDLPEGETAEATPFWKIILNWVLRLLVGSIFVGVISLLIDIVYKPPTPDKTDYKSSSFLNLIVPVDSSRTLRFDTLVAGLKSITEECSPLNGRHSTVYIDSANLSVFVFGHSPGNDTTCLNICNQDTCVRVLFKIVVTDTIGFTDKRIVLLQQMPYLHRQAFNELITPATISWEIKYAYWSWLKTFLIAVLGLFLWWLGRILYHKPLTTVIRRVTDEQPPYTWNLHIDNGANVSFDDHFYRVVNQLRRRSQSDRRELNIPATIHATIEEGGMIRFQFRQQTRPNEYLLLIDQQTPNNHQAQLFNLLHGAFTENAVLIERFFYESDIRLCRNEQFKNGILLKDLHHKFPDHRLIILGNGHQLLGNRPGQLAKWTNVLEEWKVRSILTPRSPALWDARESLLASRFLLGPTTLDGLSELIEQMDYEETRDWHRWQSVKDPRYEVLELRGDLLTMLHAHFDAFAPDGRRDDAFVRWVAGCAVFPALQWDLTLRVGQLLSTEFNNLLTLTNLFQLTRLPWFIQGFIPDPERKILIDWLAQRDPGFLSTVRQELHTILENNMPPHGSVAWEDHRASMIVNELKLFPEREKALMPELQDLSQTGAHKDYLALEYLNQAADSSDFVVKDTQKLSAWKRFSQLNPLYWQIPLLLIAGIVTWLYNPSVRQCDGQFFLYKKTPLCIKNEADKLSMLEYYTCDLIQYGLAPKVESTESLLLKNPMADNNANIGNTTPYQFNPFHITANPNSEDSLVQFSLALAREDQTDTLSYCRNTVIACYNRAASYARRGLADSSCYYLDKGITWIGAWKLPFSDSLSFIFNDTKSKVCPPLPDGNAAPEAVKTYNPKKDSKKPSQKTPDIRIVKTPRLAPKKSTKQSPEQKPPFVPSSRINSPIQLPVRVVPDTKTDTLKKQPKEQLPTIDPNEKTPVTTTSPDNRDTKEVIQKDTLGKEERKMYTLEINVLSKGDNIPFLLDGKPIEAKEINPTKYLITLPGPGKYTITAITPERRCEKEIEITDNYTIIKMCENSAKKS